MSQTDPDGPPPHEADLPSQLAEAQRQLQSLREERIALTRSLEFHERDRQLLAFEIHDGIVQDMTAALMFLESASRSTGAADETGKQALEKGIRLLRGSVTESRRLIQGLIPVVLDERGLAISLRNLAERFRSDHGLEVKLVEHVRFTHLTPAVEMMILRIVQESLNNVWRHSQSTKANVKLEQEANELEVSVQDWGVGFDPALVHKTRYGLTGMRERARLFGGNVRIESSLGQGTLITLTLPLASALLPAEFHSS